MVMVSNNQSPEIFKEIIRTRISDYIKNDVKKLVDQKTEEIIMSVLGNLQLDVERYADMLRYETNLVIKAVYNGIEIPQKEQPHD